MSLILNGTDGLSDVDGTAATPAIRGTDTNTGIFFPAADTIAFSEGGTEAARFDASGNLGIGTTTPNAKLTSATPSGNTAISVIDTSATTLGTETNYLSFFGTSNGGSLFTTPLAQIGGVSQNGSLQQGSLVFNTTPFTGSSTERMRIDSTGNLLVGITSTTGIEGAFISNLGVFNSRRGSSDGNFAGFFWNGTSVGSITTNGTNTTYATSSDYRLKENIAPMTGALATVLQFKPVTYNWKIDGSASQGFIAHELQAVVPDAVIGEKDAVETYTDEDGNEQTRIKPQGIDTSFLVATLAAAIQELKATVDAQAARIAALEAAK